MAAKGECYVFHPESSWKDHVNAGISKPVPFTIIVGRDGEYRSFCDLADYNIGRNPKSAGVVQVGEMIYWYITGLRDNAKPDARATGIGSIVKMDTIPQSEEFSEILYLGCHREILETWSEKLSKLKIFYSVRSHPEWKIRVQKLTNDRLHEWQYWANTTIDGVTYDWCQARISTLLREGDGVPSRIPIEIIYEKRQFGQQGEAALKSELFISYRFKTDAVVGQAGFPRQALLEDRHADYVMVNDLRGNPRGRPTNYTLTANDAIPFAMDAPVIQRAVQKESERSASGSKALGLFAAVTFGIFCLIEIYRRKNKHNKSKTT